MTEDIYKRLARFLDDLPAGFPPTESGVEIRILKRLFTPEEAELTLHMKILPEEARVIARRAKIPVEEAATRLEAMSHKGLIYRKERPDRETRFSANQFLIGIWEYHVNDLDLDLIRDFNEYLPTFFNFEEWKKAPQLRTIPINRSLEVQHEALPYEDALKLIESHTRFLEAPCICRREHRMVGKGCDKPEGMCLIFGSSADYYHKNGMGKYLTKEEVKERLKKADEAGLVLQPSFAQRIANICCCCGCCCQVLKSLKRHPQPADLVASSFIAAYDPEACIGCGVCVDRCQMEALVLEDDKAVYDAAQCIGCGLCITTCPSGALTLERKPGPESPRVPEDLAKAAIRRARVRGKFTNLLGAAVQSKIDRHLTPRQKGRAKRAT